MSALTIIELIGGLTGTLLIAANEFFLVFSQWIVTPSTPSAAWPTRYYVQPSITAVAYAIGEPLWSLLWLYIPIPAAFLMAVACNLHFLMSTAAYVTFEQGLALDSIADHPARGLNATKMSIEDGNPAPGAIASVSEQPKQELSRSGCCLAFLVPAQTAEASNAALLLLTQSFYVSSYYTNVRGLDLFLKLLFLLFFVMTRYEDYQIAKVSARKHFVTFSNIKFSLTLFWHLALVFLLRICVRKLLGLDLFPILTLHDSKRAEELFGAHRYAWLKASKAKSAG